LTLEHLLIPDWLNAGVTTVQFVCTFAFIFFGWRRAHQVRLYFKRSRERKQRAEQPPAALNEHCKRAMGATVCIQCPVYNEPDVIDALLDKIGRIRWPMERLVIQILDDSNDHTTRLIKEWMIRNPELSSCMRHVRRPNREGYKAGNLVYGMKRVEADFFAIFHADFRPNPDYLERMMPYFDAPEVGAVQARWDFNNRRKSWITLLQSAMLDPHFHIEQTVRCENNYFVTFNGTAGIWRRKAIEDAGGWSYETVTEDLDLCFRAQMRGWRVHYEPSYAVPSELPPTMTAFKAQQMRWTKGTVQVFRKLMLRALRSPKPWPAKLEATHHLGIGFFHPLLAMAAITNLPHTFIQLKSPNLALGGLQLFMCLLTCTATLVYFLMGNYAQYRSKLRTTIAGFFAPLKFTIGFAFSLTTGMASLQGLFEKGGEFVRTPKGAMAISTTASLINKARIRNWIVLAAELGFGAANLCCGIYLYQIGYSVAAFFMALQSFGLLTLALTTVWERFLLPKPVENPSPQNQAEQKKKPKALAGV